MRSCECAELFDGRDTLMRLCVKHYNQNRRRLQVAEEMAQFVRRFWAIRTAAIQMSAPPETMDDLAVSARALLAKVKEG